MEPATIRPIAVGVGGWIMLVFRVVSLAAAVSAAVYWYLASTVGSPNQDTLVAVLKEANRLSSNAAMSAAVAAVCSIFLFVDEWELWPWQWRRGVQLRRRSG